MKFQLLLVEKRVTVGKTVATVKKNSFNFFNGDVNFGTPRFINYSLQKKLREIFKSKKNSCPPTRIFGPRIFLTADCIRTFWFLQKYLSRSSIWSQNSTRWTKRKFGKSRRVGRETPERRWKQPSFWKSWKWRKSVRRKLWTSTKQRWKSNVKKSCSAERQ